MTEQPRDDKEEVSSMSGGAIFVAILGIACRVSWALSPITWILCATRHKADDLCLHLYVLAWLVFLSWLLWKEPVGWPTWLIVVVVVFRLQELFFATLDDALHLTLVDRQKGLNPLTPIALVLVSILQVVVIFAVLYATLCATNGFANGGLGISKTTTNFPPSKWTDFLYLSWNSLAPVGNRSIPISQTARNLVMIESGVGLTLVAISIAAFTRRAK